MDRMRRGTVLVEFALAAVGLVALAFVVTRVGVWLNESILQRNNEFRGTRMAAANMQPGDGPVRFDPPSTIHLIGPAASSTGGAPPQPPGSYDTSCNSTFLTQLTAKQQALWTILFNTDEQGIPGLQDRVDKINTSAKLMVAQANQMAEDAATIVEILGKLTNEIDPRLDDIHNMDAVQGTGDHVIELPSDLLRADCSARPYEVGSNPQTYRGLHNIDERIRAIDCQRSANIQYSMAWTQARVTKLETALRQLDPDITGTVAWHLDASKTNSTAWKLEQAEAACEGGSVLQDGPGGTPWEVTACFGHDLGAHSGNPHKGMDFGANLGTPVLAFKEGTVVAAVNTCSAQCGLIPLPSCTPACSHGYGNYVRIRHSDGTYSLYAHLSSVNVANGDPVSGGDPLGGAGTSGKSTGVHLHLEVQNTLGTPIDPLAGNCCDTDGFGTCGIPPVVTTSSALGSATTGTCDLDRITNLQELIDTHYEPKRLEYLADSTTIPGELGLTSPELGSFDLGDLTSVTGLKNTLKDIRQTELTDERNALIPLLIKSRPPDDYSQWGRNPLESGKRRLLNHIDSLLRKSHTNYGTTVTWRSLWNQLRPGDGPLAPDLSDVYWDKVVAANGTNQSEPSMTAELEELLWRLWWMIRQRLDYAQSEQTEFDPDRVDDNYTVETPPGSGNYDIGNPFSIPEDIEGCSKGVDGIVTCTAPLNNRARYLELNRLIQQLKERGAEVRELIMDIEGLEHMIQYECASEPDPN